MKNKLLLLAARYGRPNIARTLINHKADIDATIPYDTTPLIGAIYGYGPGSEAVANLLLMHGADMERATSYGTTPLIAAAYQGNIAIVNALIRNKANIEATDKHGKSALLRCSSCYNDRPNVIDLLLANGADIKDRDNNGDTAVSLAAMRGHIESVKTLITNKANIGSTGNGEQILLLQTAAGSFGSGRHHEIAELLLKLGAKIDDRDEERDTALIHAARAGKTKLVSLLLKYKANIEATNRNGDTALMASIKSHWSCGITQLLLAYNAEIEKPTSSGTTLLIEASRVYKFKIGNHDKYSEPLKGIRLEYRRLLRSFVLCGASFRSIQSLDLPINHFGDLCDAHEVYRSTHSFCKEKGIEFKRANILAAGDLLEQMKVFRSETTSVLLLFQRFQLFQSIPFQHAKLFSFAVICKLPLLICRILSANITNAKNVGLSTLTFHGYPMSDYLGEIANIPKNERPPALFDIIPDHNDERPKKCTLM